MEPKFYCLVAPSTWKELHNEGIHFFRCPRLCASYRLCPSIFGNDEVQTLNNELEKTESEFVPRFG